MAAQPARGSRQASLASPTGQEPHLGVIFLGPNNGGKTTMLQMYGEVPREKQREGTTFSVAQLTRQGMLVNGVSHTILFRDVPGQDVLADNLPPSALRQMHVAVVVADISRTFNADDIIGSLGVDRWVETAHRIDPDIQILLALNKVDLVSGVKFASGNSGIADFADLLRRLQPQIDVLEEYLERRAPRRPGADAVPRVFAVSAKTRQGTEELLYAAMRAAYAKSHSDAALVAGKLAPPIVDARRFGQRALPKSEGAACRC